MAKYLMTLRGGLDVTAGKVYEIVRETPHAYYVLDDVNDERECLKLNDGFTYVTSNADILATKHTQLATLTAEIAQLEAQLAEESRLKVGDYARVTDMAFVDNFDEGDIVFIEHFDDSRDIYVFRGESILTDDYEWFAPASLTKITPEEARASLIAKIDAHFGGQEAK